MTKVLGSIGHTGAAKWGFRRASVFIIAQKGGTSVAGAETAKKTARFVDEVVRDEKRRAENPWPETRPPGTL
ncbi:MAG: hypothetical protein KGL59_08065 [Acidobacteriota bacterium]|nr:hypothetical protein [Acidobacteriota bacterium]